MEVSATSRNAMFAGLCVPMRIGLAVAVKHTPSEYLPIWGCVSTLSVVGNLIKYATHDDTQRGAFNQPVWWNTSRLVHALCMVIFAILALLKHPLTWIAPLVDVAFGVGNVVGNYTCSALVSH